MVACLCKETGGVCMPQRVEAAPDFKVGFRLSSQSTWAPFLESLEDPALKRRRDWGLNLGRRLEEASISAHHQWPARQDSEELLHPIDLVSYQRKLKHCYDSPGLDWWLQIPGQEGPLARVLRTQESDQLELAPQVSERRDLDTPTAAKQESYFPLPCWNCYLLWWVFVMVSDSGEVRAQS